MSNTNLQKPWINDDVKLKLKEETDIISLLRNFGAEEILPTNDPNQFKTKCIFRDCQPQKNDYPLGINTEKKIFQCWHCGRRGDIFELIMKFKNLSFYLAKKYLLEWNRRQLKDTLDNTEPAKTEPKEDKTATKMKYRTFRQRLTGLRITDIPDLENKGITSNTAELFGVGYCSQGMMKGRIVVPIYDSHVAGTADQDILAYAGYSVTNKQKEYGDWKFPDGFEKGKELYNLNRITVDTKHAKETLDRYGIIVVESFWNVLKLYQAGITNVVAIMGTSLTNEQEKLLLSTSDKITLWIDNDEAGEKAVTNILNAPQDNGTNGLIYKTHIKLINPYLKLSKTEIGDKTKPYHFTEEEIQKILN
jgi:DNA primase